MKLRAPSDEVLMRRVGHGDQAAEAALHSRYWRVLVRYASSLLRRSEHDAEDIAQDVLARALVKIRAGEGPDELRPWLFRLTRNRSIDEVRRARWGEASLSGEDGYGGPLAGAASDPARAAQSREALRDLVSDLADLPVTQRTALLTRVVDGASPQETANRLGVSVEAAQMLVVRGRATLTRQRDARAAGGDLDVQLRALAPPALLLPLSGLAGQLLALGGTKVAVTAAVAVTAVTVVAAGGLVVDHSKTTRGGEPSPVSIVSAPSISRIGKNGRLPPGVATVTAKVRLPVAPAGTTPPAPLEATLTCPAGMLFSSLLLPGAPYLRVGYGLKGDPYGHPSRSATIRFGRPERSGSRGTIGIVCRHQDTAAALAKEVAALRVHHTVASPRLRGHPIVLGSAHALAATGPRRTGLWITMRLGSEPRRAKDGRAAWVQIGNDPIQRFTDADRSTASGHCYDAYATGVVTGPRAARRVSVRTWLGDGRGAATLTTQRLNVDSDMHASNRRSVLPTWRLGCFSPHL